MSKEIIGNVFKNLVGYFAIVFVGEFIIKKIYAPVGSISWCFAFGNHVQFHLRQANLPQINFRNDIPARCLSQWT